jgi:predicted O-methyltransferase YrrM
MLNALAIPTSDPTPIFEAARAHFASDLLIAAVHHLKVFDCLASSPLPFDEARRRIGLAERPAMVLFTALRSFGLLVDDATGRLCLTETAREHLVPGTYFEVADYIGLGAGGAGVLDMVERLRTDRPAGSASSATADTPGSSAAVGGGVAFIYRKGMESAMEQEASARRFTLALAGRAKNVAPVLAARLDLSGVDQILDVGGGTGIYSIALLQKHPRLRARVWDRPEVLKVAAEMAVAYGVTDRLELLPGDMFADPVPTGAQVILLSNILHDWDVPTCQTLVDRLARSLPSGGRLLIHDVFLNDALDGPLPVALYSANLFADHRGSCLQRQGIQRHALRRGAGTGGRGADTGALRSPARPQGIVLDYRFKCLPIRRLGTYSTVECVGARR